MNTSRRNFLKSGAALATGSLILNKELLASSIATPEIVGLQLYSVREDMMKDPLGTLKAIAGMGYKNAEHANYINRKFYGYSAIEFKKILNDLELKMPSGHTVFGKNHWDEGKKDFTDAWKYTVEDAAVLGQQFVISPWMDVSYRKSYDTFMELMDIFNKCGELCKKSDMRFGYHNHDFEFSEKLNDQTIYDLIMQKTDPEFVVQQLDIGNLYNGGANAMEVVKKYPGRFLSVHVKDEIKATEGNEKYESTILGKGIVNVKEVIDIIRKNTKNAHYIIEQESYQGKKPIDCAREDLAIMKKWEY